MPVVRTGCRRRRPPQNLSPYCGWRSTPWAGRALVRRALVRRVPVLLAVAASSTCASINSRNRMPAAQRSQGPNTTSAGAAPTLDASSVRCQTHQLKTHKTRQTLCQQAPLCNHLRSIVIELVRRHTEASLSRATTAQSRDSAAERLARYQSLISNLAVRNSYFSPWGLPSFHCARPI
jgi:hypothetical protein